MAVADIRKKIGKNATMEIDKFKISVSVMDAKNSYGQDRYLVTPDGGTGSAWVSAQRLNFGVWG